MLDLSKFKKLEISAGHGKDLDEDVVSVSIQKTNKRPNGQYTYAACIRIGATVMRSLGWLVGDPVSIYFDYKSRQVAVMRDPVGRLTLSCSRGGMAKETNGKCVRAQVKSNTLLVAIGDMLPARDRSFPAMQFPHTVLRDERCLLIDLAIPHK